MDCAGTPPPLRRFHAMASSLLASKERPMRSDPRIPQLDGRAIILATVIPVVARPFYLVLAHTVHFRTTQATDTAH
jgi:hypothetical protein